MKTKLMKQRQLYQIEHSEFNAFHLNILPQIVGPMADSVQNIMGNYAPEPSAQFITTPRQGLQGIASSIAFAEGCSASSARCSVYDSVSVTNAVSGADLVVVCLGTGKVNFGPVITIW